MFRMFVPDQPATGWRWYAVMVLTTIMCVFFVGVFGHGSWTAATQDNDRWAATFSASIALLFLVVPFAGAFLKKRTAEIQCPKYVQVQGRPALHFPGDKRGMQVSAFLWPVLAALLIALFLPSDGEEFHYSTIVFFAPPAFLLSFTVFALAGRFVEDGTFLTESGVTIRARGLRAELPWASIAGAATYKQQPFPYERIAIYLHPGSPREVSVTVPWWIGSPRPRGDTVFLTKVQVPGFFRGVYGTNPGTWIARFADSPPTAHHLEPGYVPPTQARRARFVSALRSRAEHREGPLHSTE